MVTLLFGLNEFWSYVVWWIIFVVIIAALYFIYKLSMYLVGRFVKMFKLSPGVKNGVRFLLRLVFIILIFVAFTTISDNIIPGGIPSEIALVIGSVTGTIFALSTTTVVQNFVAGIYMIITRPFKIGDLVRIGEQEGIVEEISLNHTKLRRRSGTRHFISNLNIINSSIENFTVTFTEKDKEGSSEDDDDAVKERKRLFSGLMYHDSITRYAFTLKLPKENPGKMKSMMDSIRDLYANDFARPIEFITCGFEYNVLVKVILVAVDPKTILRFKEQIIKDIYQMVH